MTNGTRLQELLHVLVIGSFQAVHELDDAVDVVHHAYLEMVDVQKPQFFLEGRTYQADIATALVLTVHPARADMPLDDPLVRVPPHGKAQVLPDMRVCHPAVHVVHARLAQYLGDFARLLRRTVHPLGPEADLAHLEARLAQHPVSHASCPFRLSDRIHSPAILCKTGTAQDDAGRG